jgi:hypothetical protein
MKNYHLLSLLTIMFLFAAQAHSQCPGCVVNMGCTVSPAAPKICPDTLPPGTAMQPYSVDLSFYLPANFDDPGSGYNVDLNRLDVLNIVGMPYGLSFETSAAPSNTYYPSSNPPASEHGCARICGTPLIAGQYTITVFVLAHVSVPSMGGYSTTSNSSFSLPLTILPASSSNNGFTIQNPFGCAPHTTAFTTNYPSNGNSGYSYTWQFGNGNMSNQENPPVQIYSAPGNYPVQLQTVIDTLGYFLDAITVNAATGCNDSPWSAPDYFFKLKQGSSTIHTSAYVDNTDPPVSFNFTPFQLQNLTYAIEIWEYDDGLLGGDDYCGVVTFNGHNSGTHTLQNGTLIVTYSINHPTLTLTDNDTIRVFPSPTVSNIAFSPNDSVCAGDSILLEVITSPGMNIQWYRDTAIILNANDSVYYATVTGTYYAEVTNSNGCRSYSDSRHIVVVPNPSKPTFWITGNILQTNVTGVSLQWCFDGNPISGANASTYIFGQTGNYYLLSMNSFGCTTSSDTVFVTYNGIEAEALPVVPEFTIMPNPNDGRFVVAISGMLPANHMLNVYDLTGRTVFSKILEEGNDISAEVDLSGITSGFYLVELRSDNASGRKKILIR